MSSPKKIITLLQILILVVSRISTKKVAVVTGGNRGIGFAIVKSLCNKFDGDVYLTARDEGRGLAAVKKLNEWDYKPKFHLLDVTIRESVEKLRDHLQEQYGGIDILVNNAGVAFKIEAKGPIETPDQVRETMQVNYFGLRDTCDILFPILKPHARVVNLSGSIGHLSRIPNKQLHDTLASDQMTEEKLSALMTSFMKAAESGTHAQEGWPDWAYSVSKTGVFILTRIQQRELSKDKSRPDIVVNHVHPGYVRTDMTKNKGRVNVDAGAEPPVYLALLPENCTEPKGDFVWNTLEVVGWK